VGQRSTAGVLGEWSTQQSSAQLVGTWCNYELQGAESRASKLSVCCLHVISLRKHF